MLTKQVVLKSKDLSAANFTDIQAIKPQIGFVFGWMRCVNGYKGVMYRGISGIKLVDYIQKIAYRLILSERPFKITVVVENCGDEVSRF